MLLVQSLQYATDGTRDETLRRCGVAHQQSQLDQEVPACRDQQAERARAAGVASTSFCSNVGAGTDDCFNGATVALQTLLGVPHNTVRTLRSFLQQHGINILTSEKISRRYVTTPRHAVESGTVIWKVKEKNKETKKVTEKEKDVAFARVLMLRLYSTLNWTN
jgi:hypothetical protein